MKYMKEDGGIMKYFIALIALVCLPTQAQAYGSILWVTVHDQIASQDKELMDLIDETFDVAPAGEGIRPLKRPLATGERYAPFDFFAKPKGTKGDETFHLTFERANEKNTWSVLIQKK